MLRVFLSILSLLFLTSLCISCGGNVKDDEAANLAIIKVNNDSNTIRARKIRDILAKFSTPKTPPRSYDWLASFNESGQTFEEYIASDPTLPTTKRNKIYIMPVGKFSPAEDRVMRQSVEYIKAFYGYEIKYLAAKPLPSNPSIKISKRINNGRDLQIKTGYILDEILKPAVPDDAVALLGFTTVDLFPNDDMLYVFGQASFNDRIGIWSLNRLKQNTSRENFLLRSMKIAVHETGHMFSIKHCTKYECVMNGTNHLGETDSRPSDTCSECTGKIIWANKEKASERYHRMLKFLKSQDREKEAAEIEKKLAAVGEF